jgi:hypothetical protein
VLQVCAEHGQEQKIQENVPDSAVQENVSKGLPDAKPMHGDIRPEPEPIEPEPVASLVEKQSGDFLQEENRYAGYANGLDGARKVTSEVKAITVTGRKGSHEAPV